MGPEFGAVIGILFYCAYVVGIANYAIGFAHALVSQTGIHDTFNIFPWNPPGSWVETFVASLATLVCAVIGSRGVYVGSRVLLFIFTLIVVSIVTSMLCLLISTTDHQTGHTAFNVDTLRNNTGWDLTPFGPYPKNSPFLMFTVLFPGFTGVIAGANLSGELKTPRESIAVGTLSALVFALVTYGSVCFVLAATVERGTLKSDMLIIDTVVQGTTSLPVVFIGICSTTLSSVLSYMLGAPRVLQAMARDGLFPSLKFLAVGSGPTKVGSFKVLRRAVFLLSFHGGRCQEDGGACEWLWVFSHAHATFFFLCEGTRACDCLDLVLDPVGDLGR